MGEPEKRPTFETLKWRLEDGPGEADYRDARGTVGDPLASTSEGMFE